jgi:hypothetical protein
MGTFSLSLALSTAMAMCFVAGIVAHRRGDKRIKRSMMASFVLLLVALLALVYYQSQVRTSMYEAAERQGIVILVDPLTNDAAAVFPCVFGIDYIASTRTIVFQGTDTPALPVDAEKLCKGE